MMYRPFVFVVGRCAVTAVMRMSDYRIDTQTIVAGLGVTPANGVLSGTLDRPRSLNSLTSPMPTAISRDW
jgi:hypothetical protein